jgi:uncharacterized protein (TIGR03437 family)
VVNNNGQTASVSLAVDAAAPGLFTDSGNNLVPSAAASRGQTITAYLTGAGSVTPQIASGAAPAASTPASQFPAPQQRTSVTVGGIDAPVSFIGVIPGAVGVVQINFQVPAGVATGSQSVIVTVGTAASKAAAVTVNP